MLPQTKITCLMCAATAQTKGVALASASAAPALARRLSGNKLGDSAREAVRKAAAGDSDKLYF